MTLCRWLPFARHQWFLVDPAPLPYLERRCSRCGAVHHAHLDHDRLWHWDHALDTWRWKRGPAPGQPDPAADFVGRHFWWLWPLVVLFVLAVACIPGCIEFLRSGAP